ncbi:cytochrome P450, putative [Talaromyces stipitatus ATCC 10500]|uniref:Cytochrome P450, putative n=1 Tax=Talaromyces stipitatus (strain ATCC 10500 / CBS 375.48 / QM 6759 / NRRL 1006) TaxID=441959 RepID=B8MQ45_TALSN|nr:cytochrome P450, putative [Talaromyces stipitatus ATCC 10500]EED13071.1 cytochrome P450, putative [Talaromyces stipitatus ATCC 10500]
MADICTAVLLGLLVILSGTRILSWARIRVKRRLHGCQLPPRYPHKDPILGLDYFLTELKEREDGISWASERNRFARLGRTYEVNSWGNRRIMTMDSQNIREVLGTSFDRFGVQELRLPISSSFMGKGVFTTDGEYWEYSRKLLAPMFSRSQVSDLSAFDVHLDRMFERLPRDGSTVELQGLLKLMYLDHATEMIFGKSTDTLLKETPDESAHELLDTFAAVLKRTGIRILLGRLWILTAWDTTFQKLSNNVRAVVMKYIDEAIQRQHHDVKSNANRYIIVDELVKSLGDREEICNQLLNIFLPARDAASVSLSACLFYLARHPDVWDRLRAKVLAIQGPITRDGLRSMPYMQAVLNESMSSKLLDPVDL